MDSGVMIDGFGRLPELLIADEPTTA